MAVDPFWRLVQVWYRARTGVADGASLDWLLVRCACAHVLAELCGEVYLIVFGEVYLIVAVICMVVLYAILKGYRHAQESEWCKDKQQTGVCGGKQL